MNLASYICLCVCVCVYRYLAEYQSGDVRQECSAKALEAYSSAYTTATTEWPPIHPLRLDVALSFSVFYYEIMHAPNRAGFMAKQAYLDAYVEVQHFLDRTTEARHIMESLLKQLKVWRPVQPEESTMSPKLPISTFRSATDDKERMKAMERVKAMIESK